MNPKQLSNKNRACVFTPHSTSGSHKSFNFLFPCVRPLKSYVHSIYTNLPVLTCLYEPIETRADAHTHICLIVPYMIHARVVSNLPTVATIDNIYMSLIAFATYAHIYSTFTAPLAILWFVLKADCVLGKFLAVLFVAWL